MRVQDTSGTYYWHIPTGTTQWEPPVGSGGSNSAANTPSRETQVRGEQDPLPGFPPDGPGEFWGGGQGEGLQRAWITFSSFRGMKAPLEIQLCCMKPGGVQLLLEHQKGAAPVHGRTTRACT